MRTIKGCRACDAQTLTTLLELGDVPLANALLTEAQLQQPEPRFPLTLLLCTECSLVQLRETVDPEVLFSNYFYASSFSETMLEHARLSAETHTAALGLDRDSFVVEIASNDGYLLKNFVAHGVPVLGIDPAENIVELAEREGVPTLCDFFGIDVAERVASERRQADLILANNVIAHVADLGGVAAGIAALLAPQGRAVLEFPYLGEMIERIEFDTIYHEHLCYFSLHAIGRLFERHGLKVVDVERLPIHGGSLRLSLAHAAAGAERSAAVERLLKTERDQGMTGTDYYTNFATQVEAFCRNLVENLRLRKRRGESIAAYGASAKGSTLMSFCGIGAETLDFVVDRSTVKQGRYTPGNHLPILDPAALVERRPDAVLLLTWNFAEEIVRQQSAYLEAGGEFIMPGDGLPAGKQGAQS